MRSAPHSPRPGARLSPNHHAPRPAQGHLRSVPLSILYGEPYFLLCLAIHVLTATIFDGGRFTSSSCVKVATWSASGVSVGGYPGCRRQNARRVGASARREPSGPRVRTLPSARPPAGARSISCQPGCTGRVVLTRYARLTKPIGSTGFHSSIWRNVLRMLRMTARASQHSEWLQPTRRCWQRGR